MSDGHSTMSVQLLIGEVAELLGVTTKAIRYYEGIGLLNEPERTDSGYRLYDAHDLLRLYRIKQLQELGLSLERIRILLQAPEAAGVAHDILRTLEAEITAQITELEGRRAHIRQLLAQAPADGLHQTQELPPTLKLMHETLGEQAAFEAATPSYAEQLWVQLDVFLWNHAEYRQQQRELIQYIAEHPDARAQIAGLMARITALADVPVGAEEVEILADEIVRLRTQNPILAKMLPLGERLEESTAELIGQVLTGAAEPAPAQRRLFELVELRTVEKQR